jgi:hypothetical protein
MRIIEHSCLDQEGFLPIANHKECCLVATMTVMQPRKKNGCVGELTNWTSRKTASGDGQWFVDNPFEEFVIRPYSPNEFGRPKRGEEYFPRVIVFKVGFGQRLRIGFSFVKADERGGAET